MRFCFYELRVMGDISGIFFIQFDSMVCTIPPWFETEEKKAERRKK